MMTLSIHEDDEGLISLRPADDYVSYPGNFWDNGLPVYSLAREPSPFQSLGLALDVAVSIATRLFPRIERVITGYGSHFENLTNTVAFGYGRECAVFLEHDGGLVSGVWFLLDAPSIEQKGKILEFIQELSKYGRFLLESDSCQAMCSDRDALNAYLVSAC